MTFKRALTTRQIMEVYAALARGESKTKIARHFGVSYNTIHRLTKEPKEKPDPEIKWCGTNAKYIWHLRRGEKCWLCAAAHAEAIKEWKKDNPERSQDIQRKAKAKWRKKQMVKPTSKIPVDNVDEQSA
jgi:transposase-like protein